ATPDRSGRQPVGAVDPGRAGAIVSPPPRAPAAEARTVDRASAAAAERCQDGIWFVGHATVVVDLDGVRLLTAPLLGARLGALARRQPLPAAAVRARPVDAVLISHLHHDHFDPPSLRWLGGERPIVAPRGAGAYLTRLGFPVVTELDVGDRVAVGS